MKIWDLGLRFEIHFHWDPRLPTPALTGPGSVCSQAALSCSWALLLALQALHSPAELAEINLLPFGKDHVRFVISISEISETSRRSLVPPSQIETRPVDQPVDRISLVGCHEIAVA